MSVESHVLEQAASGQITFWHRARFQFVADQVDAEAARSVLDYGAGAGGLASYITRSGTSQYFFYDESPQVMDHLRETISRSSDGSSLLGGGRAQLTVALDVIEHIEDDLAAVKVLARSTQPGGRVIITVPALPLVWSSWDVRLGHFRRYTRRSLRAVCLAAGLEPIEISYLFPEMLPAAFFRRLTDEVARPGEDASFPSFAPLVDSALYSLARATTRMRSLMPFGTSVVAVLRRPLDDLSGMEE